MPDTKDQIKNFFESFSLKQVVVLLLEEYVAWIFRYIPGFEGFTLRYLFYKLLCKKIEPFPFIFPGAFFQHSYGIEAGRNLNVNRGVHMYGRGGIKVGDYVLIGPNVVIASSQHRYNIQKIPIMFQGHEKKAVVIGNDVWIGANAVVLPGVTIADGTIVGAGAVVTSDTEPYSIVCGVPARKIGERSH
ncbi:acyltransferase [Candidatus Poribacteria bacterium]|nr:acyltransferase [Candidatus Poribacteria bacterium]